MAAQSGLVAEDELQRDVRAAHRAVPEPVVVDHRRGADRDGGEHRRDREAARVQRGDQRHHDGDEEVGELVVGERLAAQADDREHGEEAEAHAHAHLPRRDDHDREEQADVEHRVDHAQVAAAVTPAEQPVDQRARGGEIEGEPGKELVQVHGAGIPVGGEPTVRAS